MAWVDHELVGSRWYVDKIVRRSILTSTASFWTGFAPIGYADMSATERTTTWFEYNLSIPVILAFYLPWKFIKKTKFKRSNEIDLTSGRRDLDLATILAEERAIQARWPWWKKAYHIVC